MYISACQWFGVCAYNTLARVCSAPGAGQKPFVCAYINDALSRYRFWSSTFLNCSLSDDDKWLQKLAFMDKFFKASLVSSGY